MSYARFGKNSDVYVYHHVGGFVECCGCALGDKWDFHSAEDIVEHLQEHVAAGHVVPERLLDPALYGPDAFIAMCHIFLCRKQEGHEGEHTPVSLVVRHDLERMEKVRARQLRSRDE